MGWRCLGRVLVRVSAAVSFWKTSFLVWWKLHFFVVGPDDLSLLLRIVVDVV